MLAAALTLLVLPWVFVAMGRAGEPLALYAWVFSKVGLAIISVATAAGFVLGSERMANVFSFFWGTHPVWEEDWFQRLAAALVVVVAVGVIGHLVLAK